MVLITAIYKQSSIPNCYKSEKHELCGASEVGLQAALQQKVPATFVCIGPADRTVVASHGKTPLLDRTEQVVHFSAQDGSILCLHTNKFNLELPLYFLPFNGAVATHIVAFEDNVNQCIFCIAVQPF